VSESEAAYLGVGAGSPGSREATGEGGEGFISPEAAGAPIYSHPGGEKLFGNKSKKRHWKKGWRRGRGGGRHGERMILEASSFRCVGRGTVQ
jgi:hypothetical protein